jgi:hypothetical protein
LERSKAEDTAFAEFCDVYEMQDDFSAKVEEQFGKMIASTTGGRG